ncbi:HEAT repeat domain-containing protein [Providencia sp.]|uniref:HEAT repeat domain-containing protein n=1 Tax=Providencia sp. TaxID=589 RepID=UPI003340AC0E
MNSQQQISIIDILVKLTNGSNNEVKITAISALGDYKATIHYDIALNRLIDLCNEPNKDVVTAAIKSLSKLSPHFR